jgi:phosphoenolpyruvate carboxylase
MSMVKSNFSITRYISKDPVYSGFRQLIQDEFDLTKRLYLELTQETSLMEKDPLGKQSIVLRERIVLPLLTIQHYALTKLHDPEADPSLKDAYAKLVTRSMFGVINAARNSA